MKALRAREFLSRATARLRILRPWDEAARREHASSLSPAGSRTEPRAKEGQFHSFVHQSWDGIVIIDGQGSILEWNQGEERITGIPRSEAVGQPIWDLQYRLAPDEKRTAAFLDSAREKTRRGVEEGLELRRVLEDEIQRPDGERRIVQSVLFAIPGGGQMLAGGICRDVTERKRLEEDLRAKQALLAEAERVAHLGHWERDLRSGLSSWSNEVYRILGHQAGSFSPSTGAFLDAVAPADREQIGEALRATERDGLPRRQEYRIITTRGAVRCLLGTVELFRDPGGAPARLFGTVQDITEREHVEEALRRTQEDLKRAQAVARVGSWRMDVQHDVLEWSEETYRMFGIPQGTPMTYESFLATVHPEDRERVDRSWQAALRGVPYDVEHRIVVGDDVRWVRELAQLEFDREGNLSGGFGTVQEISDRKAMEQSLADASRHKDEFLAMLSHELRNPLAPLRTSVYVLSHARPEGEQARRMQAIIERQVSHLTRLVDDLLDVTRISRGKIQLHRERVELGDLVRRICEDLRPTFTADRIQLELRAAPRPLRLVADPTRIAQIVGNLLGNAAKFTPSGGRVDVSLQQDGGDVLLRVRDTGVGIARDLLDRLFEPFTQADRTLDRTRGGLGLGLALVKGLSELHGGSVTATSEGPGRGAEFEVRLPLESAPEEPVAFTATRPAGPSRVLVIEDNKDAADSLEELLQHLGHEVRVAYDGPSGLETARVFRPECVLCDIGLPGMDGYEVARRLRADEDLRSAVLVALTGYALPEDQKRAAEAGFARHVAKPFSLEVLDQVLRSSGSSS